MPDTSIIDISAQEILDSRGVPTVETKVRLEDGTESSASVPSGASVGKKEAVELRDHDKKRYFESGVLLAIESVKKIEKLLKGVDATQQKYIDQIIGELDGTPNKSSLGANAILSVSLAVAKAAALSQSIPLFQYLGGTTNSKIPNPMINVINGGAHANNTIQIQEFMIIPRRDLIFSEAIRKSAEVFHNLRIELDKLNFSTSVGDEGGFTPNVKTASEVLDIITKAITASGYEAGEDFFFGLDVASNNFFKLGTYVYDGQNLSSDQMIDLYKSLICTYPITSLEDPMAEDDWEGWKNITADLGKQVQLVGDDVFTTNCSAIQKGLESGVANAVVIKPNQVGTVTETFEAVQLAKSAGYRLVASHRSGETEDTSISHIAVAAGCEQIKAGSLSRSERLAKYNELLRIEKFLAEHDRILPF